MFLALRQATPQETHRVPHAQELLALIAGGQVDGRELLERHAAGVGLCGSVGVGAAAALALFAATTATALLLLLLLLLDGGRLVDGRRRRRAERREQAAAARGGERAGGGERRRRRRRHRRAAAEERGREGGDDAVAGACARRGRGGRCAARPQERARGGARRDQGRHRRRRRAERGGRRGRRLRRRRWESRRRRAGREGGAPHCGCVGCALAYSSLAMGSDPRWRKGSRTTRCRIGRGPNGAGLWLLWAGELRMVVVCGGVVLVRLFWGLSCVGFWSSSFVVQEYCSEVVEGRWGLWKRVREKASERYMKRRRRRRRRRTATGTGGGMGDV